MFKIRENFFAMIRYIFNVIICVSEDDVRMDIAVQSSGLNACLWIWILFFFLPVCSLKEYPHLQQGVSL